MRGDRKRGLFRKTATDRDAVRQALGKIPSLPGRLDALRGRRSLGALALAVGVPRHWLYDWHRGRQPGRYTLELFADAVGLLPEDLWDPRWGALRSRRLKRKGKGIKWERHGMT